MSEVQYQGSQSPWAPFKWIVTSWMAKPQPPRGKTLLHRQDSTPYARNSNINNLLVQGQHGFKGFFSHANDCVPSNTHLPPDS